MKKIFLILVVGLVMMMAASCAPREWFLMGSEGIFTYDRYTGRVELLWETKTGAGKPVDNQDKAKNSVADSVPQVTK